MTAARRMRGFKRWMKCHGIECSDALLLSAENAAGADGAAEDSSQSLSISVKALCDLKEGDVVATIPKQSCLTVKTSAASDLIEEAELGGDLGLAVAIMFERSLGTKSKWFQYFQILPPFEPIPLLWSIPEIDSLLSGTELHKIIKEDKALVCQDWKDYIKPLLDSDSLELNPDFFTVDEYLAAKSLIASRSFQIDEYHGSGMVPLADLFNHKTAAEDVHFTSVSSSSESDTDTESENENENANDENSGDDEPVAPDFDSVTEGFSEGDLELSSTSENEPTFLEMIMIKDVNAGSEVFNTYGSLGNAALLHRYGFTEPDNPFDILNIDLDIVVQWSSSLFSRRHSRRRLSLWRKLNLSGSGSEDSDYFEISFNGEPELELLLLLYVILLPEEKIQELGLASSSTSEVKETPSFLSNKDPESRKKLLLTKSVCRALLSLADARESLYGRLNSLEEDVRLFNGCCHAVDSKLYHSLMLRISERRILEKLRSFASSGAGNFRKNSQTRTRKRAKRT
ncbi:hypothetical protein ABFS82_06G089300 [Erythranthe guttata]|nr:PREDICTED: N-lysine methyltransferase SETD6 [Erythranthe guttata]|eukprot:XP_012858368.1 PREDICTED: N-lysine methyltransferase SETD6 [Erythranthe guttata]